jgi:hypothetical protein
MPPKTREEGRHERIKDTTKVPVIDVVGVEG